MKYILSNDGILPVGRLSIVPFGQGHHGYQRFGASRLIGALGCPDGHPADGQRAAGPDDLAKGMKFFANPWAQRVDFELAGRHRLPGVNKGKCRVGAGVGPRRPASGLTGPKGRILLVRR
jgi:hypothetical protein